MTAVRLRSCFVLFVLSSCAAAGPESRGDTSATAQPTITGGATSMPSVTTPPESASWYSIEGMPFDAGPVVVTPCCPEYPGDGPARSVVWVGDDSSGVQLLVLTADPAPLADPRLLPTDERYEYRLQPDGALWTIETFGLEADVRSALVDAISWSADGFTLADESMTKLAEGLRGVGARSRQVYAGDGGRLTLSVGDYRGDLEGLADVQAISRTTIAGASGFELTALNDLGEKTSTLVWPAKNSQWGVVRVPAVLDSLRHEVADSIVASDPPEPLAMPASPGGEQLYVADVYIVEFAADGPMIAFDLEGPVPSIGDVPLAQWNWDDVSDETFRLGRTWGGPWRVVGTWDTSTFRLTQPPLPVPVVDTPPLTRPTDGCDEFAFTAARDQIVLLDRAEVGPFTDNVNSWDGHCGIVIDAFVDSDALRDLLAPFADQIDEYRFMLTAVD